MRFCTPQFKALQFKILPQETHPHANPNPNDWNMEELLDATDNLDENITTVNEYHTRLMALIPGAALGVDILMAVNLYLKIAENIGVHVGAGEAESELKYYTRLRQLFTEGCEKLKPLLDAMEPVEVTECSLIIYDLGLMFHLTVDSDEIDINRSHVQKKFPFLGALPESMLYDDRLSPQHVALNTHYQLGPACQWAVAFQLTELNIDDIESARVLIEELGSTHPGTPQKAAIILAELTIIECGFTSEDEYDEIACFVAKHRREIITRLGECEYGEGDFQRHITRLLRQFKEFLGRLDTVYGINQGSGENGHPAGAVFGANGGAPAENNKSKVARYIRATPLPVQIKGQLMGLGTDPSVQESIEWAMTLLVMNDIMQIADDEGRANADVLCDIDLNSLGLQRNIWATAALSSAMAMSMPYGQTENAASMYLIDFRDLIGGKASSLVKLYLAEKSDGLRRLQETIILIAFSAALHLPDELKELQKMWISQLIMGRYHSQDEQRNANGLLAQIVNQIRSMDEITQLAYGNELLEFMLEKFELVKLEDSDLAKAVHFLISNTKKDSAGEVKDMTSGLKSCEAYLPLLNGLDVFAEQFNFFMLNDRGAPPLDADEAAILLATLVAEEQEVDDDINVAIFLLFQMLTDPDGNDIVDIGTVNLDQLLVGLAKLVELEKTEENPETLRKLQQFITWMEACILKSGRVSGDVLKTKNMFLDRRDFNESDPLDIWLQAIWKQVEGASDIIKVEVACRLIWMTIKSEAKLAPTATGPNLIYSYLNEALLGLSAKGKLSPHQKSFLSVNDHISPGIRRAMSLTPVHLSETEVVYGEVVETPKNGNCWLAAIETNLKSRGKLDGQLNYVAYRNMVAQTGADALRPDDPYGIRSDFISAIHDDLGQVLIRMFNRPLFDKELDLPAVLINRFRLVMEVNPLIQLFTDIPENLRVAQAEVIGIEVEIIKWLDAVATNTVSEKQRSGFAAFPSFNAFLCGELATLKELRRTEGGSVNYSDFLPHRLAQRWIESLFSPDEIDPDAVRRGQVALFESAEFNGLFLAMLNEVQTTPELFLNPLLSGIDRVILKGVPFPDFSSEDVTVAVVEQLFSDAQAHITSHALWAILKKSIGERIIEMRPKNRAELGIAIKDRIEELEIPRSYLEAHQALLLMRLGKIDIMYVDNGGIPGAANDVAQAGSSVVRISQRTDVEGDHAQVVKATYEHYVGLRLDAKS